MKKIISLMILLALVSATFVFIGLQPKQAISVLTTSSHQPAYPPDEWWIVQKGEPREVYIIIVNGEIVELTKEEWIVLEITKEEFNATNR